MTKEIETYQGMERSLSFVARRDDRLWKFCTQQWHRRWSKGRAIPFHFHEGEVGWWFPALWLSEFIDTHGMRRTPKRLVDDFRRFDQVAGAQRSLLGDKARVGIDEMESWQLPTGTRLFGLGFVRYPDGSEETFASLQARKPKFHRGGGRMSNEQQNLEDLLRMVHEKGETAISPALATSPLTKADWATPRPQE